MMERGLAVAFCPSDCCTDVSEDAGTDETLDPADREAFGFDAAAIDWDHYIAGVHTPSVSSTMRALTSGASRGVPKRRGVSSGLISYARPEAGRRA